jgi:hypothetical protein
MLVVSSSAKTTDPHENCLESGLDDLPAFLDPTRSTLDLVYTSTSPIQGYEAPEERVNERVDVSSSFNL